MIDALLQAVLQLARPDTLSAIAVGTSIGLVAALLPGFGGVATMAIMLPITFTMQPQPALVFLVSLMAASGFAGSVTSILINMPGDGINAATLLDGYPMARQGRAGVAIGASAAASALGALVGLLILSLSLPLIRQILLVFGPAELFAFTMAGVSLVATVSERSLSRGLVMAGLGLLMGAVGLNMVVGGEARFTFGVSQLIEGIPLVPAIIGLFALPELYGLMRQNRTISTTGETAVGGTWEGVKEVLRRPVLLVRSSLIGTGVGMLPGVGGAVSSWVSYFAAMNSSKDPSSFGKGNVEGVIAPEAANDAKEGGSMMPVLALGIPGSVTTALLLTAFLIQGVSPGRRMFEQNLDLVWLMIIGMVMSNVLTSAFGLAFARILVRITLVPIAVLAPLVLSLSILGSFIVGRSYFSVLVALVFGVLGFALRRLRYPLPPLLIGLLLYPIAESNFHLAYRINRGSYAFLAQPLTAGILLATATLVVVSTVRRRRRAASPPTVAATEEAPLATRGVPAEDVAHRGPADRAERLAASAPAPRKVDQAAPVHTRRLLASELGFILLVAGLLIVLFVQTWDYGRLSRLFPWIVLASTALALIFPLVETVQSLRRSVGVSPESAGAHDAAGDKGPWFVAAWMVAILVAYILFGMVWGTVIYIALFQILFDRAALTRRRVLTAFGCAALGWYFTAQLVEQTMRVRLLDGWLL